MIRKTKSKILAFPLYYNYELFKIVSLTQRYDTIHTSSLKNINLTNRYETKSKTLRKQIEHEFEDDRHKRTPKIFFDKLDKTVQFYDLKFKIKDNIFTVVNDLDNPKDLISSINKILKDLSWIQSKGFLNTSDLNEFLIVKDILSNFTTHPDFIKSFDTYKWIYNLILLSLYNECLKIVDYFNLIGENSTDEFIDLETIIRSIYVKLDPTIRLQLQGRGISIIKNIYTGFDTEYTTETLTTNNLVSVQLAVSSRVLLKLPIYEQFSFKSFNTDSGLLFGVSPFKENIFNIDLVIDSISLLIKELRLNKFKRKDESINEIINVLERYDVPSVRKSNYIIFGFNHAPIKTYIHYSGNKESDYSLKSLLNHSSQSSYDSLEDCTKNILRLLESIHNGEKLVVDNLNLRLKQENNSLTSLELKNISIKDTNKDDKDKMIKNEEKLIKNEDIKDIKVVKEKIENLEDNNLNLKRMTRTYNKTIINEPISVSKYRFNYVIGHLTQADLSMLSDFNEFKDQLDIVNNSLVTLGKGFDYNGYKVIIRDTMLLSPAGRKSLSTLGDLYNLPKISLSQTEISNMDKLLQENKDRFDEYAIRDAVITLIHALSMENFSFTINEQTLPLTLSSLGQKYVLNNWENETFYDGYQLNSLYKIGEVSESITPKSLSSSSTIGLKIPYYIANYKGGRNESFMYGCDSDTIWYDYDLISAYTTALSLLGHPSYSSGKILTEKELSELSDSDVIMSYTIIKCSFKFPSEVKYPSIPCYLDETTSVYPLEGDCVITGSEYILARNQGCEFSISEIFRIPFDELNKPFYGIIKEIQEKRRENPKGSFLNLLYKEIGNSIYGSTVRGINNVKSYDAKTKKMKRMTATVLSNPIIASWTTSFIRSVIGECLHNIYSLGGKIVSVTTDGFITDLENIEERMIPLGKFSSLLNIYREIRNDLSDDRTSLEVKHQGKGMISWTTRGQLSSNACIVATTGFQRGTRSLEELDKEFREIMKSDVKSIEYQRFSLRSGKIILNEGGHVTPIYTDQIFRLLFDNLRLIDHQNNEIDLSKQLLDSKPFKNISDCKTIRSMSSLNKKIVYYRTLHKKSPGSGAYKSRLELGVRTFIKGILIGKYNLNKYSDNFKNYSSIIDFIHKYDSSIKLNKYMVSHYKNRKIVFKSVPKTKETISFINFVKNELPDFDEVEFFQ